MPFEFVFFAEKKSWCMRSAFGTCGQLPMSGYQTGLALFLGLFALVSALRCPNHHRLPHFDFLENDAALTLGERALFKSSGNNIAVNGKLDQLTKPFATCPPGPAECSEHVMVRKSVPLAGRGFYFIDTPGIGIVDSRNQEILDDVHRVVLDFGLRITRVIIFIRRDGFESFPAYAEILKCLKLDETPVSIIVVEKQDPVVEQLTEVTKKIMDNLFVAGINVTDTNICYHSLCHPSTENPAACAAGRGGLLFSMTNIVRTGFCAPKLDADGYLESVDVYHEGVARHHESVDRHPESGAERPLPLHELLARLVKALSPPLFKYNGTAPEHVVSGLILQGLASFDNFYTAVNKSGPVVPADLLEAALKIFEALRAHTHRSATAQALKNLEAIVPPAPCKRCEPCEPCVVRNVSKGCEDCEAQLAQKSKDAQAKDEVQFLMKSVIAVLVVSITAVVSIYVCWTREHIRAP